MQHNIDISNPPIKMHLRHLPLVHQEVANMALWKMQQVGIGEPSDTPWATPVILVPKKNNQWRFQQEAQQIDEALDQVAGSIWFTSFNLQSTYWQDPHSPSAKPKTAFCTNHEHCQFRFFPLSSVMLQLHSRG